MQAQQLHANADVPINLAELNTYPAAETAQTHRPRTLSQ